MSPEMMAEIVGEILKEELGRRDELIADLRRELAEATSTEARRTQQAHTILRGEIGAFTDDLNFLMRNPPEIAPGLGRPNDLVVT